MDEPDILIKLFQSFIGSAFVHLSESLFAFVVIF